MLRAQRQAAIAPSVMPRCRQRGVALIMALVVTFVAVGVAGLLAVRQHTAIERTAAVVNRAQVQQYLDGVEAWVGATLEKQIKRTGWIGLEQPWAQPLPDTAIGEADSGRLSGQVEDLQGRFNLNNLVHEGKIDALAQARFARLLQALELPANLAQAVTDWLGARVAGASADTQGAYYLGQSPPYVAANRPFASVTTLRLVRGVTPAIYARLAPYVSALPAGTAINVNTASQTVLRAIGLTAAQAASVAAERMRSGYKNIQAFMDSPALNKAHVQSDRLAVSSRYFAVRSRIGIGGRTSLPYVSILSVDTGGRAHVMRRAVAFAVRSPTQSPAKPPEQGPAQAPAAADQPARGGS